MPKFLGGIYNHMISPTTGIIPHQLSFCYHHHGLNSDYDYPYFPAISVAAKSEKLVIQAYRSSHINDDTHHFTAVWYLFRTHNSRLVHKRSISVQGPAIVFLVQNDIKHVILVNITAPTELLGKILVKVLSPSR